MKKLLALCFVLGIFPLTSCSVTFSTTDNKNSNDSSSSESSVATENNSESSIATENNSESSAVTENNSESSVAPNNNNNSNNSTTGNNSKIDLTGMNNVEVDVEIETGNCNVNITDSNEAVINAKISDNSANVEFQCNVRGNTIDVDFIDSSTGMEIDDSQLRNISTDVDISIPATVKNLDISVDRGNVAINTNGKSYEEIYSEKDIDEQEKGIKIDGSCYADISTEYGDITVS